MNKSVIFISLFCCFFFLRAAEEEIIEFVYAGNYPPYSFSDNSVASGVLPELVEILLAESLGYTVSHEILPWARCQMLVEQGRKDGIFTIPTPKRESYSEITSNAVYHANFVMWTGINNPNVPILKEITSLEALESYEKLLHIKMRGAGWHARHLSGMKKMQVQNNPLDIHKLLAKNRADVYIEQEILMHYQLARTGFDSMVIKIPAVLDKTGWHIMISKKSKHVRVIDELNKLLERMSHSGELEQIVKRVVQKYVLQATGK